MKEDMAPCLLDFSGSAGSWVSRSDGQGNLVKKAALSPSIGHLQQWLLSEGLLTIAWLRRTNCTGTEQK